MRRVLIVPRDMKIEDAIVQADLLGIGEIVHGIPPKIQKETNIKEKDLPIVYEEPVIVEPKPRDLAKEVTELKERLKRIESTVK